VSLGNDLTTGEDIEKAIENKIRGTSVAHIEPKRNVGKIVDTIAGVSDWYSWKWPIDEEYSGFIYARELPNVGDWVKFSPAEINSLIKQQFTKPEPMFTQHSVPKEKWSIPIPDATGNIYMYI